MISIKKKRKAMTKGQIAFAVFKYSIFVIYGFISFLPMWWMVVNTTKTHAVINAHMDSILTFLPGSDVSSWLDSFIALFTEFELFGRTVLNSVIYALIMITLVLLINSFAGYALARFKFPGNRVIETIIIMLLIVPVETSVVPLYVILYRMGLLNTANSLGAATRVVAYVLPGIVSPYNIFLFRQYFLGIPKDLEESARIDGCTRLGTYFRIVLPLSLVIFATVTIFTFMGVWNDYLYPQLIFTKEEFFPVQVFLQQVNSRVPKDMSLIMASLTFSTIPIIIVYVAFQRYIVEGVSYTGLKI